MRTTIKSLTQDHDKRVTVFLTSHNLAEVEELCDRVAIISRGRIRAIDSPQKLRSLASGTEKVQLTVSGLNGTHESTTISFTRRSGDNRLDENLRDLQKRGARILDIDVEKGSLLDVLELYESKGENQ